MRRHCWWLPLVFLLMAGGGSGAPIKGARIMARVRIGAAAQMVYEEVFEGGRRACVIAMGDHKPPVEIGIAVYDGTNQLVTEDRGVDYATAIWCPARAAKYKIVVKNSGAEYNDLYLVFK